MWNAWGYVYFSEEKYIKAIEAYNLLLNEPEGTIPLRVSALFHTRTVIFEFKKIIQKGIEYILQWMDEVETVTAQAWSAFRSEHIIQLADFNKAISSIENAIVLSEEEGYKPKENWYVLLAASIGELKERNWRKRIFLKASLIYMKF